MTLHEEKKNKSKEVIRIIDIDNENDDLSRFIWFDLVYFSLVYYLRVRQ